MIGNIAKSRETWPNAYLNYVVLYIVGPEQFTVDQHWNNIESIYLVCCDFLKVDKIIISNLQQLVAGNGWFYQNALNNYACSHV